MLKNADSECKHLFIILTGSASTTVSEIISNEYPSFYCSSRISASHMFTYAMGTYVNSLLDTNQWGNGLAVIRFIGNDVSGVASLVNMSGHKFEGYMYRRLYRDPEPVTPCHILCVMNEKSFTAYNSLPEKDTPPFSIYSKYVKVYNLDDE